MLSFFGRKSTSLTETGPKIKTTLHIEGLSQEWTVHPGLCLVEGGFMVLDDSKYMQKSTSILVKIVSIEIEDEKVNVYSKIVSKYD